MLQAGRDVGKSSIAAGCVRQPLIRGGESWGCSASHCLTFTDALGVFFTCKSAGEEQEDWLQSRNKPTKRTQRAVGPHGYLGPPWAMSSSQLYFFNYESSYPFPQPKPRPKRLLHQLSAGLVELAGQIPVLPLSCLLGPGPLLGWAQSSPSLAARCWLRC